MEAHIVVRRRGSYIFYTIGSQMAVRLSALRTGRPLLTGKIPGTHLCYSWVDPRTIVRMEGLGQFRSPMTSSGFDPATFQLVAQCLNQLRYRVPPLYLRAILIETSHPCLGVPGNLFFPGFQIKSHVSTLIHVCVLHFPFISSPWWRLLQHTNCGAPQSAFLYRVIVLPSPTSQCFFMPAGPRHPSYYLVYQLFWLSGG
jgi:hypothetical protein